MCVHIEILACWRCKMKFVIHVYVYYCTVMYNTKMEFQSKRLLRCAVFALHVCIYFDYAEWRKNGQCPIRSGDIKLLQYYAVYYMVQCVKHIIWCLTIT